MQAATEELFAVALFVKGNPHKQFINLVGGSGDNGKTMLLRRLFALAGLSGFVASLDPSQLIHRSDVTKPNSALVTAMKAHIAVIEEPDQKPLNCAICKEWTGNSPLTARNMYENQTESDNAMSMFVISNHLVKFDKQDQAMTNRLVRAELLGRFFPTEAARQAELAKITCHFTRREYAPKWHVGDANFLERYRTLPMRCAYFAFLELQYKNYYNRGCTFTPLPFDNAYDKDDEDGAIVRKPTKKCNGYNGIRANDHSGVGGVGAMAGAYDPNQGFAF